MMTSYDIHGPVIRPRKAALWTWVDPLGFRTNFRYDFEMDLLDALSTESSAYAMVGDRVIKTGSEYNDHYGFGTSRDVAKREAAEMSAMFEGAKVDVVVKTKLFKQAVFFDDKKKPFYNGCVRAFHVPMTWCMDNKEDVLKSESVFEIYRNGEVGKGAADLDSIIADAIASDAAGERRNGTLR